MAFPLSNSSRTVEIDRFTGLLESGAAELGVILSLPQKENLIKHLLLLDRWNRAYNLTSVRDPLEMISRHTFDSLSLLPYLRGDTILDLGTGAGFPGLPLAICDPIRHYVLLDGNGKKIRFVRQTIHELGLERVAVAQCRIESYQPIHKFNTIICRAVASIAHIFSMAFPLLERSGCLLIMKGRYPLEEMQDPSLLNTHLFVHKLFVPELAGERHLIEIRRD